MSIQEKFLEIVSEIVTADSDTEENAMLTEALEIVSDQDFKRDINDSIKCHNYAMTALDYVIFYDTRGYNSNKSSRLNNPTLLSLEKAIKDAGGKTLKELREKQISLGDELDNVSVEEVRGGFRQILASIVGRS